MPHDDQPLQSEPKPHPLEGLRGYLKEHPENLIQRIKLLRKKPFFAGEAPSAHIVAEPSAGNASEPKKSTHAETDTGSASTRTYGTPRDGSTKKTAPLADTNAESLRNKLAWNSLEEAAMKVSFRKYLRWSQPRLRWLIIAAVWIAMLVSALLFCWLLWAPFSQHPTLLSTAVGFGGMPFKIALLILFATSFYLNLWLLLSGSFPAHEPDPLFDRMIQERSPSPVSSFTVTGILADPRFPQVFYRAEQTVFPLTRKRGADVSRFIDRLIDHLKPDGRCARFFINHGITALKRDSATLYDHLEHEMREMLFAEVLDDPAFIYIYKRNQPRWRRVMAFLSTFDFERARKLFGLDKETAHAQKPDKLQTAINASVIVAVIILATHIYEGHDVGAKCEACDKNVIVKVEDPRSPKDSEDLKAWQQSLVELQGKFAEFLAQIHCTPPSQPDPQPGKVVVNVPAMPAPVVTVPVTLPEIKIPPNFAVTVTSKADPVNVKIDGLEPALTLAAKAVENHYKQSPVPIGGDDFTTFAYTTPGPPGSKTEYASNETALVVHNGNLPCTYTARIINGSLFPPDPISIAIVAADPANNTQCTPTNDVLQRQASTASTRITATRIPSYSELLHAYISVEAFHRYHLPPFHPKNIVLKLHYESEPRS